VGGSQSTTFRRLIASGAAAAAMALAAVIVSAQAPAPAAPAPSAQAPHRCAAPATEQARKLLAFHLGSDNRIEIDPAVKRLPAIRNPANRRQLFDVLEVWGTVYKAQYRMRLIYARLPGECVLMGQEVLENSNL
jgi:hypothetical protein